MKYTLLIAALLLPTLVFGAELRTVPAATAVLESSAFSVYVELHADDSLNAVEGSIVIPPGVRYLRTVTNGSLELWPQYPVYDAAARTVTFVGGSPAALPADAHLFTLVVAADGGVYSFDSAATGYRADGVGTPVPLSAIGENVAVGTTAGPVRPPLSAVPTPLSAEIGRDPALFDGAWFVTFYGGEGEVAYYEVQEGALPPAQADHVYLLQDQELQSDIVVSAVYTDGTRSTVTVTPQPSSAMLWLWGVSTLLIILLVVWLVRRRTR